MPALSIISLMDELATALDRIVQLQAQVTHLEKMLADMKANAEALDCNLCEGKQPSPGFEFECKGCGYYINAPCNDEGKCISCTYGDLI
jgi:hypothetical protein